MNTKRIRKLAAVTATAALALQLFAGASLAARPTASATGATYGPYGGGGNAGFTTTYVFGDSSTLSKLFMEAKVTGGSSIVRDLLSATRGTQDVTKDCSIQASPLAVECAFKSVRFGERITVVFGVVPATTASAVTTEGVWSTTGFGSGSTDSSHGDDWRTGILTSARNGSDDFAAGFGNLTLQTQASNNKQAAKLSGLPARQYASVNDDGGGNYGGFPQVVISVNDGNPAVFTLIITYPNGTAEPASYLHTWDPDNDAATDNDLSRVIVKCGAGETLDCFTWSKKTWSATITLSHNGTLRRSS